MAQSSPDTASVIERTRPCKADAAIVAVHFLGRNAVFVLGEEALLLVRDGEHRRVAIHGGAILSAYAFQTEKIFADFFGFWSAARFLASHPAIEVYDRASLVLFQHQLYPMIGGGLSPSPESMRKCCQIIGRAKGSICSITVPF